MTYFSYLSIAHCSRFNKVSEKKVSKGWRKKQRDIMHLLLKTTAGSTARFSSLSLHHLFHLNLSSLTCLSWASERMTALTERGAAMYLPEVLSKPLKLAKFSHRVAFLC